MQHETLLDILGACERIKKTPIPFSYAVYLKIFISAYALLLPFALILYEFFFFQKWEKSSVVNLTHLVRHPGVEQDALGLLQTCR